MGYFKKQKHKDEMGKKWWIYTPTVMKKAPSTVFVKGKSDVFVKRRKK